MACPFFLPTHRHDRELWTFRARLPLGDGWAGKCTAHDAAPPDDALRDHCNLGYAHACPHLPPDRHADAVHFSVAADNGGLVSLHFAFELGHAPAGSGRLDFDCAAARWISPHPDARLQAMAAAYLEAYFTRHPRPALSAKTS